MMKLRLLIFFIFLVGFLNVAFAIDRKYLDSILQVYKTTKDKDAKMYALYILSFEHGFFDVKKGLEYGDLLQKEAEAINDPKYKFYAYNAKANCFETILNYDSMLYYTTLSYELYRNNKHDRHNYVSLSNLAVLHRKMGHFNLALQLTLKADSFVTNADRNPREYGNKCLLFLRVNNLAKAKECITIGFQEYVPRTDPKQLYYFEGILSSHLGLIMSRQGKHDSAISTLKQSISILKKQTDTLALAEATTFMAEALFKINNYTSSAAHYHLAAEYYSKLNNKINQQFMLVQELHSKIYSNKFDRDELSRALEFCIKELSTTVASNEIKLDSYTLLSDCYEKIGDYKLSLKYSRLYDELNREVLDNENRLQFVEFQKSFDVLNRENKINQLNQLNTNNALKLENKNLQLNRYIIIVISLSLLFLVSWILFMQITKRNKALMQAKSELQIKEANEKERNRIGREMHDDIGAGLTQITLMTESVRNKVNYKELNDIADTSRQLVSSMGEIIWSLNSEYKTVNDLFNYLREQLNKLLEYSGFEYIIQFAEVNKHIELSNQQRRNIVLFVKETVNNAIKYSQAKKISITSALSDNKLSLSIEDDGVGFDIIRDYSGNGLKNIKQRIEEIGGTVHVESIINKGTLYVFTIPI